MTDGVVGSQERVLKIHGACQWLFMLKIGELALGNHSRKLAYMRWLTTIGLHHIGRDRLVWLPIYALAIELIDVRVLLLLEELLGLLAQ